MDCKWCPVDFTCHVLDNVECDRFILFRGLVGGIVIRLWQYVSTIGIGRKNSCTVVV